MLTSSFQKILVFVVLNASAPPHAIGVFCASTYTNRAAEEVLGGASI